MEILIEQNRCAMACESYVQRFLFIKIKKAVAKTSYSNIISFTIVDFIMEVITMHEKRTLSPCCPFPL